MTTFRPACAVRFKLSFDENLTLAAPGPLESVPDRVRNPPSIRGVPVIEPLVLQTTGDASFTMPQVPLELNFEKPGYRQAGKFSMRMPFRNLPIDPRTVRAAAVEIYTGAVADTDFAAGYRNTSTQAMLQTSRNGDLNTDTLRMVGVVDEWQVESNDKGSIVTIEGRDLRGLLIDVKVAAGGNVSIANQIIDSLDLSMNVQEVVTQLLRYNPNFDAITVLCNPADWPNGVIPSPGGSGKVARHRLGARGKRKGGRLATPAASRDLSFWDLIVNVSYLVGGIPYFQWDQLTIRPGATVYDKLRGPVDPVRNPTPFQGGNERLLDLIAKQPMFPPLRVRRLVYGRDVQSLTFSRKLAGRKRPKVVRVIAVDQTSDRVGVEKQVRGIWPPVTEQEARRTKGNSGKGPTQSEIEDFPAPSGITDPDQLTAIAEALYNEIGRGELGGAIVTKNLSSFGGDNTDPDLLRLDPGDGVEILVDTHAATGGAPLVSSYTDANRDSFESQVRKIESVLRAGGAVTGEDTLARVIVATARGQVAELQSFFRVENVKYNFDKDKGAKISFDFQNYVVIRSQVEDANPDPGDPTRVTTPGGSGTQPGTAARGQTLRSL